ncbi:LmeA family phospholipid-binding protein [Saccharopolyspora sp. NPDC000359]|uniref:LmeA family phospholipid-binding protein n=1 Tax=Saccharopolyspora sp. NPDC000359 TaxID=3154251 RepID=UPI003332E19F
MKKLVIALVIIAGLLVGADFGGAAIAEYQVSKKVAEQLQLPENPEVRINGFPFLTQVVAGNYRDVQMAANAVQVGPFNEVGIEADLHGAKVSTSELIAGTADHFTVDELVGRVKLKASDVARLIGIQDLTINPAAKDALADEDGSVSAADEQLASGTDRTKAVVQLDGTVNIAGSDNKVRVIAVLSLVNGKMQIEPRKLDLNNSTFGAIELPSIFEKSVLQQFSTTLDPGMLPFEVKPTAVHAERGALVVEGIAEDVTITPDGVTTG